MAGTIISGTITTGIVLDDPATEGTLTVTAAGRISKVNGDAVFGATAFPWTVKNLGTIQSTGTAGRGIQLVQGGTVTNGSSLYSAALIEGYDRGVLIKGGSGSVTNFGRIRGSGTDSRGVNLSDGGRVVNGSAAATGALIEGSRQGVFIGGAAGTVSNFGTIASTPRSGIVLNAGGTVTNGASASTAALITGAGSGVYVNNGFGAVANFGHIVGGTGVNLHVGGVVTNGLAGSTAATITGTNGNAVLIAGTPGTVSNFGTINATGTSSAVSLIEGGRVANGSAAVISTLIASNGTGVYVAHSPGTVINFGTIASTSTTGSSVILRSGGSVTNSGVIQASNSAMFLGSGGSVTNTKNGLNSGLISGGTGTGISFRGGAGTVTNSGTIESLASVGINLEGGGDVLNQANGLISGTTGIYTRGFAISATNAGTIRATGSGSGILLTAGGSIDNRPDGTIAGGGFGVNLTGRGDSTVINSGTITGTVGVFNSTSGDLTLTNSGTIVSTLGTAGTAVDLGNSVGTNLLIVKTGSVFIGNVDGGGNGEIDFVPGGAANMANVFGFATVGLGNGVSHSLTLTDANFGGVSPNRITVRGGDSGNIVNATGVTLNLSAITFVGGAGADKITGGASNDFFLFSAATLTGTDVVAGKSGFDDRLVMTSPGTVNATGVTGVESFQLAGGGANSLTLTNSNFTGVSGGFIRVYGGSGGNTVNGSGVTNAANQLVIYGGAGTDTFTGGAGNDVFVFTAAALGAADKVAGGAGNDTLLMTTAGTIKAAGVRGIETFALTSGGANTLTLANANFIGVTGGSIRVVGGDKGNTVDASALSVPNQLVFIGGAGNDKISAGPLTTMTGGAGTNQFTFDDIGTNSITDFAASATNRLVLCDAGFDLGSQEGLGTASLQHLAAGSFVANATGTFTTAGQRFAYNTTTGNLRYDADGNGAGSTAASVAVLTDHAALTAGGAGNLFFTS